MEKINIAIVEDDPLIRESLENFLIEHPSLHISLVAQSMEIFLEAIKDGTRPVLDLLLLDIELPGMSGIQGIYHIKQKYPQLDIVMLTTFEEEETILDE